MTPTEEAAAAELLREDPDAAVIKMTATGNPDFIVIPKAAMPLVRFVEVKSGADVVHEHQYTVHERLRSLGAHVDVVRIDKDKTLTLMDPGRTLLGTGPFGMKGSPEYSAKMAALQKIVQNRPEVKARVSERTKAALGRRVVALTPEQVSARSIARRNAGLASGIARRLKAQDTRSGFRKINFHPKESQSGSAQTTFCEVPLFSSI